MVFIDMRRDAPERGAMVLTKESLQAFLSDELGIDGASLAADSPLFSSGLIDSFSLVALMTHIEQVCGFRIGPNDVNLDNFDSLGRILSYAEGMQAQER